MHSSDSYSACGVYLEPNRQKSLPEEAYLPVSRDRQHTIKIVSRDSQRKPSKFISPWLFMIVLIFLKNSVGTVIMFYFFCSLFASFS